MSERKHNHYFKSVVGLEVVDVYRLISLFEVNDPCLQHAIKKLFVAGGRGAKSTEKDVQEAIDSLQRFLQMRSEDAHVEKVRFNRQFGPLGSINSTFGKLGEVAVAPMFGVAAVKQAMDEQESRARQAARNEDNLGSQMQPAIDSLARLDAHLWGTTSPLTEDDFALGDPGVPVLNGEPVIPAPNQAPRVPPQACDGEGSEVS